MRIIGHNSRRISYGDVSYRMRPHVPLFWDWSREEARPGAILLGARSGLMCAKTRCAQTFSFVLFHSTTEPQPVIIFICSLFRAKRETNWFRRRGHKGKA